MCIRDSIGIALGQAFTQALGDKRGITRYGQFLLPMDETLVLCAADLSGRDYLGWAVELPAQKVGEFDKMCIRDRCTTAQTVLFLTTFSIVKIIPPSDRIVLYCSTNYQRKQGF